MPREEVLAATGTGTTGATRLIDANQDRFFPLVVQGTGEPVPFLRTLAGEFGAEVRTVPYEFQAGANQMLVVPGREKPAGR